MEGKDDYFEVMEIDEEPTKVRPYGLRVFIPMTLVVLVIGLILGSGLTALFISIPQFVKESQDDNEPLKDTDGDGVPDEDERITFRTDPKDSSDMLVRTGLLLKHSSLNEFYSISGTNNALIVTEDGQNSTGIISVRYDTKPERIVWGKFTMKLTSDSTWEVVAENVTGFEDRNIEINLQSSVSLVCNGMSLGYGIVDDVVWFSFDDIPSLFSPVMVKGVMINSSFILRAGFLSSIDISADIEIFEGITDQSIDFFSRSILIAENVSYPGEMKVKGDVIKKWNSAEDTGQTSFFIDDEDLIWELGYYPFILEEESTESPLWLILAPLSFKGINLDSIVTLNRVLPLSKADYPLLDDLSTAFPLTERVKLGLLTSSETENEVYLDSMVSRLKSKVTTRDQVAVSVDCYVLWTTAQDVIRPIEEESNLDLSPVMSFLTDTDLDNAGFGLMIDLDLQGPISEDSLLQSIGIAISPGMSVDGSRLLMSSVRGVVHGLEYDSETGSKIPLLIVDESDVYDNLMKTTVDDIGSNPLDYRAEDQNQIMVELEGYLVGTTVKTVIDHMDDVSSLSFLKILQYFPHDICVYQLFEVDMKNGTVNSIPIVQVVPGRGDTYLGELKRIRGWFNNKDIRDILPDLVKDGLSEQGVAGYLQDYLRTILSGNQVNFNLSTFLMDKVKTEFHHCMEIFLPDLNNKILADITKNVSTNTSGFENLFSDDFTGFIGRVNDHFNHLSEQVSGSIENLTTTLTLVKSSNAQSISLEKLIEDNIRDDLTFDELSNLINQTKAVLNELNVNMTRLESYTKQHFDDLINISNNVSIILNCLRSIQFEIQQLFGSIATQLRDVFLKTIQRIDITEIIKEIKDLFPYYGWFPPPPTFDDFVKDILDDLLIGETKFFSEFYSGTFDSFEELVNNSPDFDFLDDLSEIVSNQTNYVWRLYNDTSLAISSYSVTNSTLSMIRSNLTICESLIIYLETEADNLDEERTEILAGLTELEDGLSSNRLLLVSLSTTLITEQDQLLSSISGLISSESILIGSLEEQIELEMIDSINLFISDLLLSISYSVNSLFNNLTGTLSDVDAYFAGLFSDYVAGILSLTNSEFWPLLVNVDINQIKGYIIVYTMNT